MVCVYKNGNELNTNMKKKERFIVKKWSQDARFWKCTDRETEICCIFKNGNYAETHEFGEFGDYPVSEVNEVKTEMSTFLHAKHYDKVFDDVTAKRVRICKEIKRIREKRGLTMLQVAEKSGLHASHVSNIESGEYAVNLDTLIKISSAIDMQIGLKSIQKRDENSD